VYTSDGGGGGGGGVAGVKRTLQSVSLWCRGTSGTGRGRCLVEWSMGAERRMAAQRSAWPRRSRGMDICTGAVGGGHGRREADGRGGAGARAQRSAWPRWGGTTGAEKCMAAARRGAWAQRSSWPRWGEGHGRAVERGHRSVVRARGSVARTDRPLTSGSLRINGGDVRTEQ